MYVSLVLKAPMNRQFDFTKDFVQLGLESDFLLQTTVTADAGRRLWRPRSVHLVNEWGTEISKRGCRSLIRTRLSQLCFTKPRWRVLCLARDLRKSVKANLEESIYKCVSAGLYTTQITIRGERLAKTWMLVICCWLCVIASTECHRNCCGIQPNISWNKIVINST